MWGTQYIDQLLYWQHDGDGDGDFTDGSNDRRYYTILDRNFSVIGLKTDTGARFEERVRYTPYGQAQASLPGDVNNDGSITTTDLTLLLGSFGKFIGAAGYIVEADFDHNGQITTSDLVLCTSNLGASIPAGDLSALNSIVGYNGYLYEQATGLYCVRYRWYDPNTGRWIGRDPIGYAAGSMDLYEYVVSSPLVHIDSRGLEPENVPEGAGVHIVPFGDPSTRFEDIWRTISGCHPAIGRTIHVWEGEGRDRKLVKKEDRSINDARMTISHELLMCLFMLESDLDPNAVSLSDAVGLGQMTEIACNEVDRVLKRPKGTCWADQNAKPGIERQFCNQIANTLMYLSILLAKQTDGNFRDALKRYGPGDAGYAEYSDPILECEKCLKGKPKCKGQEYPNEIDRTDCFKKAKKSRRDARSRRGK